MSVGGWGSAAQRTQPSVLEHALSAPSEIVPVALAGTFTIEPLAPVLELWARKQDLTFALSWAPYGQIFQALVDPSGVLRGQRSGVCVLLIRTVDLGPTASARESATRDLRAALETSVTGSGVPHIVVVCPSAPLENFAACEADERLAADLRSVSGVDVVTGTDIDTLYLVPSFEMFDAFAEHEGAIPYTEEYFAALGTIVARRIRVATSVPKKVLVLDCDDTLWGGICAEVGPSGVVLDGNRLELQRFALEQRAKGVLLAVVSKNNEADALAVFDQNPEMVLRREHITTWRINWSPKSENILDIARELELGVDTFVFLDDDAFVCTEARERAPGLVAVQLPADPLDIPTLLRGLWVLDRGRVTVEDQRRAELYRERSERDRARRALSHADFLATLDLVVSIAPLTPEDIPRVAQLTQRTNQFNASGRIRSEAEVAALSASGVDTLVVSVRDRFGDYGLTGVVMFSVSAESLLVDTFLLSCRVLGRGVEHSVIRELASIARTRSAANIAIPFKPTAKNAPYGAFFAELPARDRRAEDGGELALLTVADALDVRFVPKADAVEPESKPVTSGSVKVSPSSFDHREVALSLSTVEQIRAALPRRGAKTASPQIIEPTVDPPASIEAVVAAIWCDVLLLESVGHNDDLFDIGGDSISALRILAKVHAKLGIEIALHDLFRMEPTVARIAEEVRRRQSGTVVVARSMPPPVRGSTPSGAVVSYCQQALLDWEGLRPSSATWIVPFRLRLRGALDIPRLREAIAAMAERQDVWRTAFDRRGSEWVPRLCRADELPFDVVDAVSLTDQELATLLDIEANRGFVIDGQPLVKAILYVRGPEDHVLFLAWHQVVHDPTSSRLITEEIAAHYVALGEKRPPNLPALDVRYVDYAALQRQWYAGEGRSEVDVARKRLVGAQPLDLAEKPRRGPVSTAAFERRFELDDAATRRVIELSRVAGGSLFNTFGAIVAAILARWSGRDEVVFMTPVSQRNQQTTLEPVVGRFVNWIPVRIGLPGDLTMKEMIECAADAIVDAHTYEAVPAALVFDTRGVFDDPLNRILLNTPAIGTALIDTPVRAGGLELREELVFSRSGARNDLAFVLGTSDERMFGSIRGAADLFDEATIVERSDELRATLSAVHPEQRLSELAGVAGRRARAMGTSAPSSPIDHARELIAPLLEHRKILGACLFGSLSRPYGDERSDADIAIVVDDATLAEIPVSERHLLVGGKNDVWHLSESDIRSMCLSADLRKLSKAQILHDSEGKLAALLDSVTAMPDAVREANVKLRYFELTFLLQKLQNAQRRERAMTLRMLTTELVVAASSLLFVLRGEWPPTLSWTVDELTLAGVSKPIIEAIEEVLETADLKAARRLRGLIDEVIAESDVTYVSDPRKLLEWYFLTEDGQAARERWGGNPTRLGF